MRRAFALALFFSCRLGFAQQRAASDFEIAAARSQLTRGGAMSKIAAHLNLGDIYAGRGDRPASKKEYESARTIAIQERLRSRTASDLSTYARATGYEALAQAKLGLHEPAVQLFEESLRYASDSPQAWNLYASAMLATGRWREAAALARNAVTIADRDDDRSPHALLDRAVYRYTLASALARSEEPQSAVLPLEKLLADLSAPSLNDLRDEIARNENFEILSSTDSDAGAYLSLMLRGRLKLAELAEQRGDLEKARAFYRLVLKQRTDDPTALVALARLDAEGNDGGRRYQEAFEANAFSLELIEDYESFLQKGGKPLESSMESVGSAVRRIVEELNDAQFDQANQHARLLLTDHPGNETALYLAARAAAAAGDQGRASELSAQISDSSLREHYERRAKSGVALMEWLHQGTTIMADETRLEALVRFLASGTLTSADRELVDQAVLSARVTFLKSVRADETTLLDDGRIGKVRIRFSSPTSFRGRFEPDTPLTLQFRALGAGRDSEGIYLLAEPLGVTR